MNERKERVKWLQDRGYRKVSRLNGWFWLLKAQHSGVVMHHQLSDEEVRLVVTFEIIKDQYYKFAATFKREVEKKMENGV